MHPAQTRWASLQSETHSPSGPASLYTALSYRAQRSHQWQTQHLCRSWGSGQLHSEEISDNLALPRQLPDHSPDGAISSFWAGWCQLENCNSEQPALAVKLMFVAHHCLTVLIKPKPFLQLPGCQWWLLCTAWASWHTSGDHFLKRAAIAYLLSSFTLDSDLYVYTISFHLLAFILYT